MRARARMADDAAVAGVERAEVHEAQERAMGRDPDVAVGAAAAEEVAGRARGKEETPNML